jgi:RimJ/RimL family protein N-acetyltransferase
MTVSEAETLIRDRIGSASNGVGAAFAVVDDEDRLLGSVSLFSIDWKRSVGLVAYWLAPEARGRGLATHAVRSLTLWAFETLGLARLELRVDVRNQPSQRVAERAGFQREGLVRSSDEIHGERNDEYLYSLLPADPAYLDLANLS